MSASRPITVAAHRTAQNSHRSRGHVIVLPGRGENEALYERFSARLAFDGYAVTVAELPAPEEIDASWIDSAALWDDATELGDITLIGSDSGAVLSALLADRLAATGVVVAGIGGIEREQSRATGDLLPVRSACPLYQGKLTVSGADLNAPRDQWFGPEAAARLRNVNLGATTLVIHGEEDQITPLSSGLALYGEFAPTAEVVTVAGGRHDILNDVTHRSVAAEIVQFLERRSRPVLARVPRSSAGVAA